MDLITNTWTVTGLSDLATVLYCAGIIAVAIAFLTFFLGSGRSRRTKIITRSVAITATATAAVIFTSAAVQPRVPTTETIHHIEATGTIDSITPNLNRGGTGIRLTNAIDILFTVDDDTADTLAGLEGHPTTLYCSAPDSIDIETPALAAGTILTCTTTEPGITATNPDWLLEDTGTTTRTPVTTT